MSNPILVNFRDKPSQTGTDRQTLKRVADKLGCSETMAIHMAVNRLYRDLFVGDVEFDVPSADELKAVDRGHEVQGGRVVDDIAEKL